MNCSYEFLPIERDFLIAFVTSFCFRPHKPVSKIHSVLNDWITIIKVNIWAHISLTCYVPAVYSACVWRNELRQELEKDLQKSYYFDKIIMVNNIHIPVHLLTWTFLKSTVTLHKMQVFAGVLYGFSILMG